LRAGEAACNHCGQAAPVFCAKCDQANRASARFCGSCGRTLSSARLSATNPAPAEPECTVHESPAAPRATLLAAASGRDEVTASALVGVERAGGVAATAGSTAPLLGMGISLGLAILAQSALLRTHGMLPATPLFVAACAAGAWTATRLLPARPGLAFGESARAVEGSVWKVCLAVALAANAGSLVLFGLNTGLTLAWQLFGLSVVLAGVAFWAVDGRPGVRLDWRGEAPWLAALAALVITGAALRLDSLASLPFGLWYDEAYSGLQVQRILADPGFRPVYVGGLAQEPSLLWYLMAASVKLLGPSVPALRLPTAIGGILGIPAIYLLGRELFGRRVGLIAAGLLTTLVWHLTFSRIGFNSEWSVTLDAFGLFCLVRALKKASWTAAGLAGISLGLGLHMYYTSRLMIVVACFALLALWLARPRERFQTAWRVVLAATVAGLITGSPITEFAKLHSAEFNSRLQQASVFTEVRNQHSYAPILDNVRAHLLMFNLAGDRNARHNLPGQPELNFLLGGLFVLGLGISLARGRRPEYLLLPVWGLAMLAGGVFSVAFEAPQSLRTIDEINVVVLLCAIPLALLWQACDALPASLLRARPKAAAASAAVEAGPAVGSPRTVQAEPAAGAQPLVGARVAIGAAAVAGTRAWLAAHPLVALLPVWLAAAVWLTDPLYRHFTTAVPAGFDSAQFMWDLWWVKYSVVDLHQSPLYTSYIFAPQQVNLAFHTLVLLSGLVSIPFQLLFGLFAAFNVVLLGALVGTCVGTYMLVEQETGSRAGAFVGSLIFAFAPYKLANLSAGHLHVVSTWSVPLFALFLLRWLRRGGTREALLAGVFLAFVGLTDLNQFVLSVLLGAVLLIGYCSVRLRMWAQTGQLQHQLRHKGLGIAQLGVVSAAILSPVLAAIVDGLRHGWGASAPLSAPEGWSPDLLSFVVPLPYQPWWGAVGRTVAERFHFLDSARLVFVGWIALALAVVALSRRTSRAKKWWLVVLLFWLLSLGPLLHVAGQSRFVLAGGSFSVPLPFAILHALPLLDGLSNPSYFSLVIMLGLAILAGHGVAWLCARVGRGELLAAGLGLGVLLECLTTPLPMFGPDVDGVYQRLAQEPGNRAVLMAPAGWLTELGGEGNFDGAQLYFATVARKPIVSGEISRVPERFISFYRDQPALRVLLFAGQPPTPESQDVRQVTEALRRLGVGYIVLHHWPRFDQQLSYVTQTLRYPAFYQDGDVSAFRVPE
jgi:4-amino-4-deoxy-L-arabinose transferase-like glycosyltransferase